VHADGSGGKMCDKRTEIQGIRHITNGLWPLPHIHEAWAKDYEKVPISFLFRHISVI
jgi:hypothetical protein